MNRSCLLAPPFKFLVAVNLALLVSSAFAQTPAEEDLARKVDQLADELAKVKSQLKQMQERKLGFFWSCDTRVDLLSDELLREMRLAGCQRAGPRALQLW